MVIRRILGLIILLTALVILGGSLYAAYFVGDALAGLGAGIHDNLALAGQTSESRIAVGIHFRSAVRVGRDLAWAVGQKVIERARADGSQEGTLALPQPAGAGTLHGIG